MKYLYLVILCGLLSACSEEEISATGRAFSGAYSGYYNRPGYVPVQPTTVQPVQPYGYYY